MNLLFFAFIFSNLFSNYLFLKKRLNARDVSSWHLVLHPADARTVVLNGWGEFHPLAGFAGSEAGFVMMYSPRTPEEAAVLHRLLFAAYEYARERDNAAPVVPELVK